MSMSHPVPGAAYHGRKVLPNVFLSRTMPDIQEDTIILGVCGVLATDECINGTEDVDADAWVMSDFCAFNYLLRGQGTKQVWITANSEAAFLEHIKENPQHQPGFIHGSPYNDRKVVFSQALVDQDELTPFTVYPPEKICQALVDELRSASRLAQQSTPPRPITIFIFGHGTPDYGVYLDYSRKVTDKTSIIMFDKIHSAIADDVPTTIITTACFSGGWTIQPHHNRTMLTGAGADPDGTKECTGLSLSWPLSHSVGRASGSIFAATIIKSLTETSSPLLGDEAQAPVDAERAGMARKSIQPTQPTENQPETYNSFCRTVLSTLREKVTRYPHHHEFRFSAQDDEWAQCWMARTGIPLTFYENRWAQLPVYKSTMPNPWVNPDPLNPFDPSMDSPSSSQPPTSYSKSLRGGIRPSLGIRYRGLREQGHPINQPHRTLQLLAWQLATSCPGDWLGGYCKRTNGLLARFAKGTCRFEGEDEEAMEIAISRYEITLFVDPIVATYGLVKAQDKTLLYWDRDWFNYYETERWKQISDALKAHDVVFVDAARAFGRPRVYLADCISQSPISMEQAMALVQEIGQVYREALEEAKTTVIESRAVRQHASAWFETIGKTLRGTTV